MLKYIKDFIVKKKEYRKVTLCKECCRKNGCMIREELYSHGAEEPMFCSLGMKTRWE